MADTQTVVAYPATFDSDHKYASVNSSYPYSNPIGKGSSNTTFTQINLTTGSSAETYFYYKFDLSEIPDGAEIQSVSCSYKAYISTTSTSYVNNRSAQLYSGSTAKGSSGTFSTSATVQSLSAGSWTRQELQNARLRFYAKRGTSRTTSTYYIRFYGATLTVEYEDNATKYTITVDANDGVAADKSSELVREGNSFSVSFTGQIGKITDNGADVTDALTEHTAPDTETATSYPTSYTTSGSISGTRYQNAIGKGSSNTESGNDYSGSSSSNATIYYNFDFSSIPEDATIRSVSVVVGGHLESTSNSSEKADLQLYSGTTAKGSQTSFTSTSKQLVTMNAGTWTRAELQNARLAFTIGYYGGLVNGVDFTVAYSTPRSGGKYYVYTIGSVSSDHLIVASASASAGPVCYTWQNGKMTSANVQAIYKKVSGRWIESDTDAFDATESFIRGTE